MDENRLFTRLEPNQWKAVNNKALSEVKYAQVDSFVGKAQEGLIC
jgi:hypothetical protein